LIHGLERKPEVSLTLQSQPRPGWPAPAVITPGGVADQLLLLRRRWRMIVITMALTIGASALYVSRLSTTYTATGVLFYDPADAVTPGDPLAIQAADEETEDAVTASQAEVIASLPAAAAIAAQLHLNGNPEFNPALRQPAWPFGPWRHARTQPPASPDAVTLAVRGALNVAVEPGSRILTVAFNSTDPNLAAAAANLAMQLYLDHERRGQVAALDEAQTWLEAHASQLQAQLNTAETQLAQARAAAGLVAGAQASLTTETASGLAASLVTARATLAMDQARLDAAAPGVAADDATAAAVAPNLQPLRKEQADLSAQIQALSGTYGPGYPALAAARASLAVIEAQIAAETGRELAAAKAAVAADQAQIDSLQAALATARGQAQAEDAQSAPIRVLEDRADSARDMLHNVTLQAGELAQEASLTRPDAKIISQASPDEAPATAHRGLIVAAAGMLGLCLGVLLAGLAEAVDTSFRSGGDLRAQTGLACLAQVPEIRDPRPAVLALPFSIFAEQIRALQTGILLGGPACQMIAITAARPGEGKTTLTVALGRALAVSGRRVIALDGDIRQPGFDPVFELAGAPGVTDHLAGLAAIDAVIRHDPLSALDVIGAGGQANAALSLFQSPAMPALLHVLRLRYDVILIDVPPAFALAEGRVLARMADAAVLCVRWGDTPRQVVAAAMTLLQEANVRLLGTVLTRVNAARHSRSGFPDAEIYQPRYGGYFR
jgi:capsular exopolysaccharide synthesis family protein